MFLRTVLLAAMVLMPVTTEAKTSGKTVIRSESDLPPTRFALSEPASTAFTSDAFLNATVPALRTEAEQVLATAKIDDPAIMQKLRSGLAAIALLQNRPADAEALVLAQRAVEAKPQLLAIGLLSFDSLAAGQQATPQGRCAAEAARITQRLAGADPAVIRDEVLRRYSRVQTASVGYYGGTLAGLVDPEVKAQGSIDLTDGLLMAGWRVEATQVAPCRAELAAALKTWIDTPANQPENIWPARDPLPAQITAAKPVVAAIWESGFDISLFPGQMAIDPAEPLDGIDNDGNGVVDDAFGPTFDSRLRPTPDAIPPLSDLLAGRLGLQMAIEKGQTDLNYGDDTPEARFFAERGRNASVEDQIGDVVTEEEFFSHTHATWVASTIADGAPYIRLYALNMVPFDTGLEPQAPHEDDIDRWAAALPAAGARLRGAHVRIVNMSWALTADEITQKLLFTGDEKDPARAKARGEAMYTKARAAIDGLMRACPDILFVASAGNSDQPDDVMAAVPQVFDLPNLIVVGATGVTGRATSFTTFGKHVRLYALGEAVTVRAPGGMVMRASGTSFSAPLVVRAAADMLAVNPSLTPQQLIAGLTTTATKGPGGLPLLYPQKAIAWATSHN